MLILPSSPLSAYCRTISIILASLGIVSSHRLRRKLSVATVDMCIVHGIADSRIPLDVASRKIQQQLDDSTRFILPFVGPHSSHSNYPTPR